MLLTCEIRIFRTLPLVTPTGDSVILGDSVITKVKVDNILKGECEEYLNIIEPVSLFYENVEEGNLSYVSSINAVSYTHLTLPTN